jgi:predicted secreted acid phosphatase
MKDIHFKLMGQKWYMVPLYISYLLENHDYTQKLAVIIDLDATIYAAHPSMQGTLYPYVRETFAILCDFFDIDVFIVTARNEKYRNNTIAQLREDDLLQYIKSVYMLDKQDYPPSQYHSFEERVTRFKAEMRHKIRKEDYHIIMCCGDLKSDLSFNDVVEGGYIEKDSCQNRSKDSCEKQQPTMNILFDNPFQV